MAAFCRWSFALLWLLFLLHPAASQSENEDLQAVELVEIPQVEVQEQMKRSENICISMMLLGCMGFMMSNFYLVNWPDDDIRRISWEVISSTVSIFSAVLLFQACNKVLEYYVLEGMWIWYQLLVDLAHMMVWFIALQLVLAYLSGAMGLHSEVSRLLFSSQSLSDGSISPNRRMARVRSAEMHMEAVKINTVCWATLLGHVTGFAAINAWGTLQQAVPRNLTCTLLVPALAFAGIFCIYQATETLRKKWTELDGEEDQFEKLWAEEVAETEDDVMSLCVSFLVVQALRFFISGYLPDAEGNDPPGLKQSDFASALLLLAGFAFGGFDILCICLRKCFAKRNGESSDAEAHDQHHQHHDPLGEDERWSTWGRDICAMSTAWCLHFSVDWFLSANILADGAVLAVICAVAVTCFALLWIFVLDKLADMDFTDDEVDNSLRALIQSLGILIGFSWERSFDEAVGGLAEGHVFGLAPPVLTLLLAIVLAGMVMPAWKWYILPVVEAHKEETHKHHEDNIKAVSFKSDLSKPLLQDADHHADLQTQLQAANRSIEDMTTKLAETNLARTEAEKRYSELECALESSKKGAIEEANTMSQLQTQLKEKEERIQEYLLKLRSSEDSVKAASSGTQESSLLKQAKVEIADLGQKASHLQEELGKVQSAADESKALSRHFEEKAKQEANRCIDLEQQLRELTLKLEQVQEDKSAELDNMTSVATDTECRLRQVQATAEQEQASSKFAISNLKAALAKADQKADATINRMATIEKENQSLREEVSRLKGLQTQATTLMASAPAAPYRGCITPQPNPGVPGVPPAAGLWSAPFARKETRSPPVPIQRQAPVPQAQPQTFKPAAFASPSLGVAVPTNSISASPVRSMPQSYPRDQQANPLVAGQDPMRATHQGVRPQSPGGFTDLPNQIQFQQGR